MGERIGDPFCFGEPFSDFNYYGEPFGDLMYFGEPLGVMYYLGGEVLGGDLPYTYIGELSSELGKE